MEVARVFRPLADTGWLPHFQYLARQEFGADLDFQDEFVDEKVVPILGTGEYANMQKKSGKIAPIPAGVLIDTIESHMPASFRQPLPVHLGECCLREYVEKDRKVTALVVNVLALKLVDERYRATHGVDIASSYEHRWNHRINSLKLAVVHDPSAIDESELSKLKSGMPSTVELSPGLIVPRPVTLHREERSLAT